MRDDEEDETWTRTAFLDDAPAPPAAVVAERSTRSGIVEWFMVKSEALAAGMFGVLLAIAAVVILFGVGAYHWFHWDEWSFLADRSAGDLFRPHSEHWVTLPALAYRGLWSIFGINSYLPYQALLVAVHLTTAVLLRVTMRRAGAGPWIATATASVILLFGSGNDNIVAAFQITFVGALMFGLIHLLLADHDGPLDRRDRLGLGAGAAALMCSGVGITMVVIVGVATLMRRGWRMAAFHTAPLAGIYLSWYAAMRPSVDQVWQADYWVRVKRMASFGWVSLSETVDAIGHVPFVGVALALLTAAGLLLAWLPLDVATFRTRAAIPTALLAGWIVFLTTSAYVRWWNPTTAGSSRYLYIGAALFLPAVAVAADAIARRWRPLGWVVIVLALGGIPGNIGEFGGTAPFGKPHFVQWRERISVFAASDEARAAPPDFVPFPFGPHAAITAGWLVESFDAGRIPAPDHVGDGLAEQAVVVFGVAQVMSEPIAEDDERCRMVEGYLELTPEVGDQFWFTTPIRVTSDRSVPGADVAFDPRRGNELSVVADDLELRLLPARGQSSFRFCE